MAQATLWGDWILGDSGNEPGNEPKNEPKRTQRNPSKTRFFERQRGLGGI